MTRIQRCYMQCAICRATSKQVVLMSTNTFGGSPDLDMRPPEMKRSTLCFEIQTCPSCGYCAPSISESAGELSAVVNSDEYRQQLKNQDFPDLADQFLSYSILKVNDNNHIAAAWASLRAAWVCDDSDNSVKSAEYCRRRALDQFAKAAVNGQEFDAPIGTREALMVDLYRRTGQFVEARSMCYEGLKTNPEEYLQNILLFQLQLITKQDVACHGISEVDNSKSI